MQHSADFQKILSNDPILAAIVNVVDLPELSQNNTDLYLDLTEAILSQQLSIKAASTIIGRFKALFPDDYPKAELLVEMSLETLRGAGVSQQKAGYLKSLAAFHLDKGIIHAALSKMEDEEIIRYLLPIKGVGRWTVEMMLMFALCRPDVFPIDDLAIRQKMVRAYALTETGKELRTKLIAIAEKWAPHRSLACRYLWKWTV